jgi:hypothetical protein
VRKTSHDGARTGAFAQRTRRELAATPSMARGMTPQVAHRPAKQSGMGSLLPRTAALVSRTAALVSRTAALLAGTTPQFTRTAAEVPRRRLESARSPRERWRRAPAGPRTSHAVNGTVRVLRRTPRQRRALAPRGTQRRRERGARAHELARRTRELFRTPHEVFRMAHELSRMGPELGHTPHEAWRTPREAWRTPRELRRTPSNRKKATNCLTRLMHSLHDRHMRASAGACTSMCECFDVAGGALSGSMTDIVGMK